MYNIYLGQKLNYVFKDKVFWDMCVLCFIQRNMLTHLQPILHFYTPNSEGIEVEHWLKSG